ncbi:MAG: hypothetical protein QM765_51890 [Myxococcales bacterium]
MSVPTDMGFARDKADVQDRVPNGHCGALEDRPHLMGAADR